MRALRFKNSQLALEEIDRPSQPGEALVRVIKSGICNTDLEIVRGYAGFEGTIGHEFVGVVEECEDKSLKGSRVVGEINAGCGNCLFCNAGDTRHCPTRTVLGIVGRDGCHAEFLSLPMRNLLKVPDNVSNEEAVFAEPLAAAVGITEQVEVEAETKVAVIGDGKLGLLIAMSLGLYSDNVVLIGRHREKMALVADLGIETQLSQDASKRVKHFDVVVEASGSESGFALALDLVRPRGKLVLKSTFAGKPVWEAWRVVVDEITIVGSRCGRFGPALDLLRQKKIDVSRLISDEFSLSNGVAAMNAAAAKGSRKVLLDMS